MSSSVRQINLAVGPTAGFVVHILAGVFFEVGANNPDLPLFASLVSHFNFERPVVAEGEDGDRAEEGEASGRRLDEG